MQKQGRLEAKQKGAVVILMAFIIGLGVLVYLLNAFDPAKLRLAQDKKTYQALNAAKQALIAWSVGHVHSPGQMLWPDRHLDPGVYDGSSDCVTTAFQYSYLLGQLPSLPTTSPCLDPNNGLTVYPALSTYPGLGQDFRDAQGNRLWYAVSRNLVRDYVTSTNPIVNPDIINAPAYPWLEVLDRNGGLISNRVAAVILAPGEALAGQNRTGAADASQFLDSFQIGAAVFNNRGYAIPDEDFIMGEDNRNVSANDLTFVQPYNFNDKLVYITIDELMAALEKRVGEEVRAHLRSYAVANAGNYPFAAVLGGVGSTRQYRCINNNFIGSLPLNNPADTCTYTATATSVNSVCNFQDITSVEFRKGPGNFTSASSACTQSGRLCTCTGAGSCSAGSTVFSCSAAGNCSANVAGRVRFLNAGFDIASSPTCTFAAAACQSHTVTCNGSSATVTLGYSCTEQLTTLPAWFNANRWQDYVFYQMTRPTDMAGIVLGNRNTGAMVATVGRPIDSPPFAFKGSPQIRPSCVANDYLDSTENVSTNSVYDATSRLRSNNYNDQTFVVAP